MIPLSTYRSWEGRHLFNSAFSDHIFGDHNRIYIDMEVEGNLNVDAPDSIAHYLHNLGCTEISYFEGIAKDKHGRKVKIGKLVDKSKNAELKKIYDNDPVRSLQGKNLKIVISRHPYDIAGGSHGRGWKSCYDIVDGNLKGALLQDVVAGCLVAYLIHEDDLNIQHPISRLRILRYTGQKEALWIPAPVMYGTQSEDFANKLKSWLRKVNTRDPHGLYQLYPCVHLDGAHKSLLYAKTEEDLGLAKDDTYVRALTKEAAYAGIFYTEPSVVKGAVKSPYITPTIVSDAIEAHVDYPCLEALAGYPNLGVVAHQLAHRSAQLYPTHRSRMYEAIAMNKSVCDTTMSLLRVMGMC